MKKRKYNTCVLCKCRPAGEHLGFKLCASHLDDPDQPCCQCSPAPFQERALPRRSIPG